jgi:hypothetical protein
MTDKDNRGFFIIPQGPEEGGYYTYGTPTGGAGQYADPHLMSFLLLLSHRWRGLDDRRFGIGNISKADGIVFKPHHDHRSGLEVDIRPLRKDGKECPVTRFHQQYDREGTRKLIGLAYGLGQVRVIYFNDTKIPHVRTCDGHNDHFHLALSL